MGVVQTVQGNSDCFCGKSSTHQGSALRPLACDSDGGKIQMISWQFRNALPQQLLYADNLVVIPEIKDRDIKDSKLKASKCFVCICRTAQ